MRIVARFSKGDEARFISHLDLQRLVQRALRRAQLPIAYSQGFNPHPLLAFASALSVGVTGDAERLDVRLCAPVAPEEFLARLNAALPVGIKILDAVEVPENFGSLTAQLTRADYDILFTPQEQVSADALTHAVQALMAGEIQVEKRTKSGMKRVDIRPMLIDMRLVKAEDGAAVFRVSGVLNAQGGLPVDLLMKAYALTLSVQADIRVHRACLYFDQVGV